MEVGIQEEAALKRYKVLTLDFYIFFHLPTIRGIVSVIVSAEM